MAADFLSFSGPPEIITFIFESCESSSDVLALASTCRHLRQIWLAFAPTIIRKLWPREIPGFAEALLAVRATQLGIDAESRGDLAPKDLHLDVLDIHDQPPSVGEIRTVLGFNHFAYALEIMFCRRMRFLPVDIHELPPEKPARMPEWRQRVHKAIYRSLTLGAVLTGIYREPFVQARKSLDPGMAGLQTAEEQSDQRALEFFQRFPVYKMQPTLKEQHGVFGSLADWLIGSILSDEQERQAYATRFEDVVGRAKCCANNQGLEEVQPDSAFNRCHLRAISKGNHSDTHFVLWQIMQMLWVSEHTRRTIRRRHVYDPDCCCTRPSDNDLGVEFELCEKESKKIRLGLFGSFEFEEIWVPHIIDPTEEPMLLGHHISHSIQEDTELNDNDDKSNVYYIQHDSLTGRILDQIYDRYEGQINVGPPSPPFTLRFFEYVLRHYFGACFNDDSFPGSGLDDDSEDFEDFLGTAGLFAHDDVSCRLPYDGRHLYEGDFHDGSEILRRYY